MEHKLINLSLEVMAARDPLALINIFDNYFHHRLEASSSQLVDVNPEIPPFAPEQVLQRKKQTVYLLLELSAPKVFIFQDCKKSSLDDLELSTFRKMIKIFNDNYRIINELKGLTYKDDVTGLYNQRYLELVLDREFSLAKRNKSPFAVLFLDLDHFKRVNDNHGHLIGSRLLLEVGQEIKRTLRESDVTFRYGGDEFVMVLTQTNAKDAFMVAERVRVQIEKKRFLAREKKEIRLTASIGVASYPEHALSSLQILKAADQALYGSKKETRNRVVLARLIEEA